MCIRDSRGCEGSDVDGRGEGGGGGGSDGAGSSGVWGPSAAAQMPPSSVDERRISNAREFDDGDVWTQDKNTISYANIVIKSSAPLVELSDCSCTINDKVNKESIAITKNPHYKVTNQWDATCGQEAACYVVWLFNYNYIYAGGGRSACRT